MLFCCVFYSTNLLVRAYALVCEWVCNSLQYFVFNRSKWGRTCPQYTFPHLRMNRASLRSADVLIGGTRSPSMSLRRLNDVLDTTDGDIDAPEATAVLVL